MKKTKFTEAQIAFILKQAEDGVPWRKSAARRGFPKRLLQLAQEICGPDAIGDEAVAAA